MYKLVLMGVLGLAVSLIFTSQVMAQEKAAATAAIQEMKGEKTNGMIENVDKQVAMESHGDKLSLSGGDKGKPSEDRNASKDPDRMKRLMEFFIFKLYGRTLFI